MCLKYQELNQFISRVRSLILGTTDPCIVTLSFFSKVLERLIFNQLDLFLEKNDNIYKHQFGFKKGYSTEQAILEITDNLNSAIYNKQITCGLFLYF